MNWCGTAFLGFTMAAGLLQAAPGHHAGLLQKHRLSHLLGMTVESSDGQRIGRVRNFIVDLQTGEIKFAIVSSGGFLGMSSKLKVMPAAALSLATAKKGIVALNITAFRWRNAPEYSKTELASLSDPSRAGQIYQFYGLPSRTETSLARISPDAVAAAKLPPTGQEAVRPPPSRVVTHQAATGNMQLASDIIGQDVVNRQQQNIGEVSDLLVDLSGQKPTLASITGGRLPKMESAFVVPLCSLTRAEHGKVLIDANQATFEQAQPFNEKAWQTIASGSAIIYRFDR